MSNAARAKKELYHARLCSYLDKYDRAFIVNADNVGSMQFQNIRKGLRPNSLILMGKNTMMKRSIRLYCEENKSDKWAPLIDILVGNVGVIFTVSDLADVKTEVLKYKVGAPARVGVTAPVDVHVPAGPTGMDPSQTSFFQVLGIATKINKGTIEITQDVHLIKPGDKVGASEAALLAKLKVKPFSYGLVIKYVFESGSLYDAKVLDITDAMLMASVSAGISNVASVCLAIGYPTLASIPHSLINGYKNVLAIALETDYSFPRADKVKDMIKNPGAYASAAPAAAAAPAAKKEEKKEESEEEDMGFSLFD